MKLTAAVVGVLGVFSLGLGGEAAVVNVQEKAAAFPEMVCSFLLCLALLFCFLSFSCIVVVLVCFVGLGTGFALCRSLFSYFFLLFLA